MIEILADGFFECLTIEDSLVTIDPLWQPENQIITIF